MGYIQLDISREQGSKGGVLQPGYQTGTWLSSGLCKTYTTEGRTIN